MTSIGAASNSSQNSKVIGKQKNANLVQTKGKFAETLKTNVATDKKDTANGELPAQRVLFIVQLLDLLKTVELSEAKSFYKWEMPEDQYQEEMQFQQRSLETRMRGLEAKYMLRPDIPDRSNYLGDKQVAFNRTRFSQPEIKDFNAKTEGLWILLNATRSKVI